MLFANEMRPGSAEICDGCSKKVGTLWQDSERWLLCPECWPLYHSYAPRQAAKSITNWEIICGGCGQNKAEKNESLCPGCRESMTRASMPWAKTILKTERLNER